MSITLVRANIASVIFSGARPPLPMLYLMPKSSVGPPGLWLADKMMPPKAAVFADHMRCGRRRQDTALADDDLAEAIGGMHLDRLLDDFLVVVASVAADDGGLYPGSLQTRSKIDWMKFSAPVAAWNTGTFLRRPEVPGF